MKDIQIFSILQNANTARSNVSMLIEDTEWKEYENAVSDMSDVDLYAVDDVHTSSENVCNDAAICSTYIPF